MKLTEIGYRHATCAYPDIRSGVISLEAWLLGWTVGFLICRLLCCHAGESPSTNRTPRDKDQTAFQALFVLLEEGRVAEAINQPLITHI